MNKLKLWNEREEKLKQNHPLKTLSHIPKMPGMAEKFLKLKCLKYLLKHDKTGVIPRYILKQPFKYGTAFLKSLFKKKSYLRDDDFFLYGIASVEEFKATLKDSLLVLGFSYCHKPFECPSGRFSDACIHDPNNPVCGQCFIGKAMQLTPKETIPLWIPTIHYIGEKVFEIMETHPNKKILFLITACEMTLEVFGDLGNMVGLKGIGVRLDGRICNTMKAFELSEKGVKPGLTVVLDHTQQRILELLMYASAEKAWETSEKAEGVEPQDSLARSSP